VLTIFEETAPKYLDQAHSLGFDLEAYAKAGLLEIVYFRPLDLSVDETLYAIQTAVDKVGAKRVVLTPHAISFLTHDIVLQRYYESAGELRKFMTVVKTRARAHSRELRGYEVTQRGIVVGEPLTELSGVITAVPEVKRKDK
jgi:circadian clock protein KaiC